MDTAVVLNRERRSGKKRAYSFILVALAGLGALCAMSALSRDTSAQAQSGVKGGPQPAPSLPNMPDCGVDWSVVSSPNPPNVDINYLNGVAALGTNNVWAVGYFYYNNVGPDHTLIEHWDGSGWSIVTSPNQGSSDNHLYAVAAVSASDVWAVGYYSNGTGNGGYRTLIEHWDGSAWTVVSSPNQGSSNNFLQGVAAVGTNDVWAVGYYDNSTITAERTLTEHWNGSAWTVVASPNRGTANAQNHLNGVAAVSANDVWAVGIYYNGGSRTLTEHWNGSAWSAVASPNSGTSNSDNYLQGVASVSANDVWAVGDYDNGTLYTENRTLIEHWNGSAWTVVSSPNPGTTSNYLQGVAAVSANDVWAVGNYTSSSCCAVPRTLIERWDGSSWQFVYSPSPSQISNNFLNAVDAVSANDVWAVGDYSSKPQATLVERYNPCTGSPTPVPSACPIQYTDVAVGSAFYDYVRCLACRGIVGGYNSSPPCTTGTPCFLPGNNVTRGQMAKFISKAANYHDAIPPNQQTFTDVPPNSTFWVYVERVYLHGVVSGYSDPARCPTGVPCYLPNKNVTRGQAARYIARAANYQDAIPSSQQTFTDVPPSYTFWQSIERVYIHTIVGGYQNSPPCTTGTPCFLPGNNVTREQTAKFVSKAFFPDCETP